MITISYIALITSGILICLSIIKYITYSENFKGTQELNLLLFFASTITFYGILHMGAEIFYGFNPIKGKFIFTPLKI